MLLPHLVSVLGDSENMQIGFQFPKAIITSGGYEIRQQGFNQLVLIK